MSDLEIIKTFPKNFIFGTATSSYQIEGQKFDGCGLSNWDTFAKKKGKTFKGQNGSIACAHIINFAWLLYHKILSGFNYQYFRS